jgi:crotonobetainyl-CoA:carnitine CoA-transferase CaiB-like acyl-CoA transferase
MQILRQGGDFIFCAVQSVNDLPDDPQVRANDYVIDFQHPRYGETRVLGIPVRLSQTPGAVRMPAPEFGQHTEEVLTDLLGYSWEQIARLKEDEVI